ncbi:unnamed protein product [Ectocarpus sp. 12 AP-2014]
MCHDAPASSKVGGKHVGCGFVSLGGCVTPTSIKSCGYLGSKYACHNKSTNHNATPQNNHLALLESMYPMFQLKTNMVHDQTNVRVVEVSTCESRRSWYLRFHRRPVLGGQTT